MTYIYNIKVNLKENLLNFYEWSKNDNISIIKKIPIYLVSNKDYINLLNMSVKLDEDALNNLVNRASQYVNRR